MNLRIAAKIAWREARASSAKFLFVILAVAAGVGSLTGVRGFSRAFHNMLLREARTLMAADLSVRVFALPSDQQNSVMRQLESRGVRNTWITETVTMLSADPGSAPVLVSIKAIDPAVYPFYGAVRLAPPGPLRERLTRETVAVSQDLLLRLNLRAGDTVRLGGEPFRIAGTVEAEPDRMAGSLNVGPRVMMTRDGLERSGLMLPGSRAAERFLFRLPVPGPRIDVVREELKRAFPDALIADFTETHPIVERGLEQATTFLSLVSLIALIVGALGVATTIQAHLQQRLDSIAIMKCLGARSAQIIRIYVIQTLGLGLAGGLLGILAGGAVQLAFPWLIARYFPTRPAFTWDPISAAQGLAIGILATLLFTVPPLLSIRRIRPGLIFRREMAGQRPSLRARWRDGRASLGAAVVLLVAIAGIAGWLSGSAKMGGYFAATLTISLLLLMAVAWLLLRALRWFSRHAPRSLAPSIRHGIANLHRPGNHAEAALVALGLGVVFTLTVYLVQSGMISDMGHNAPPGMPNVFLLDIAPHQRDAVLSLLAQQRGVEGSPEIVGTVSAKMVSINGVPIDKFALKGFSRRYQHPTAVTTAPTLPPSTKVLRGAWWDSASGSGSGPRMSIAEEPARALNISPGAKIEWMTPTRRFSAIVVSIHRTESIRLAARVEYVFTPGTLDGLPMIYYGGVRVRPDAVPPLQRVIYQQFPTVTVINMADVFAIIQDVVGQISLVVRFVSAFAILAGAIILASSVAGTRFRRIREVVILKTLGATRNRVAGIFSIEFLILGSVAGLMGSLLAGGFAALLLKRMLNAPARFDLPPHLASIALTTVIAIVAGWLASFRILGQKPLEILRHE